MDYRVIRSKRKTVAIRVLPDLTVEIRAPYSADQKIIDSVLSKYSTWIEKNIEKRMEIEKLTKEMKAAAKLLEFEHAAYLRDKIKELESSK